MGVGSITHGFSQQMLLQQIICEIRQCHTEHTSAPLECDKSGLTKGKPAQDFSPAMWAPKAEQLTAKRWLLSKTPCSRCATIAVLSCAGSSFSSSSSCTSAHNAHPENVFSGVEIYCRPGCLCKGQCTDPAAGSS